MLTNPKTKEPRNNIEGNIEQNVILDIRQARLNTLSIEGCGRSVRPGGGE